MPGKAAWLAAGLPAEGSLSMAQRVSALATDAPIAVVDRRSTVGDARTAADEAGAALVVVTVGAEALVDGAIPREMLDGVDDDAPLTTVAAPAPVTVRPSVAIRELVDRLRDEDTPWIVVTRADGTLVGAVARDHLLALARSDRLP